MTALDPVSDRDAARARFERDGFLILPGLASAALTDQLRRAALACLEPLVGPAEFEADVAYPGAPPSRHADGGQTPRRLLAALARDPVFRAWGTGTPLAPWLHALLGEDAVLAQTHHNCVMTKYPGFSSETNWHQDVRYWSFDRPELVSVWLALGAEHLGNGALRMIPGSHREELDRGRLDAELFLRPELAENEALIASAITVELSPGDVVLFDARTFHAAGRNDTDAVKLSLVYTYHRADNRPIPGTRSANYPSLRVA